MIKEATSRSARLLLICAVCSISLPALAADDANTIVVTGRQKTVEPDAREGSYEQPQWTAHRPFTNTRVYVLEEHQVEVEAWWKHQRFHDEANNYQLYQQEVEVGLGHRLQLDLYVNEQNYYNPTQNRRLNDLEGQQIEMRYAFANWGELPLNPTLYLEYHPIKNSPERAEVRLLFADNLGPAWHFALNIGYEQDLWGAKIDDHSEQEVPVDVAVGTTALAKTLSIGVELKNEWQHHPAFQTSGSWQQEIDIGPSFQWRPINAFHLDFSPLFGVKDVATNGSPQTETWLIAGYEL